MSKPPFIPREISPKDRALAGEDFCKRAEEAAKSIGFITQEALEAFADGPEVSGGDMSFDIDLQSLKGKRLKDVTTDVWPKDKPFPGDTMAYGGVHGQNVDTITFHCEDGDYVFLADGDCCSQTTLQDPCGPTEGLILEVKEPEWSKGRDTEDDDDFGDVTQYYKATLVIEGKGYLDIEYRNTSNGYYGGSLSFVEFRPAQ